MSKRRNNPRSSRAHAKVLEAALELFANRGIDQTSMDAIADASGVSKATIYKHWRDKDAMCLEAIRELTGGDEPMPSFDTGDLRADLVAVLSHHPTKGHSRLRACIMPHLMAYASRNPTIGHEARRIIFDPPRAALRRILERAISTGQLTSSIDLDLSITLLVGPTMYGHLMSRLGGHGRSDLPEQVVDAFLSGQESKTYSRRCRSRVPHRKRLKPKKAAT